MKSNQKTHHHCNLFTHPTVSQMKKCAMLFLQTCHIIHPRRTRWQFSHHCTIRIDLHSTCGSSESRPELTPKISIVVIQQIPAGPWEGCSSSRSFQHSNSSRRGSRAPLPHTENPNPSSKHPKMHFCLFRMMSDNCKPHMVVRERGQVGGKSCVKPGAAFIAGTQLPPRSLLPKLSLDQQTSLFLQKTPGCFLSNRNRQSDKLLRHRKKRKKKEI